MVQDDVDLRIKRTRKSIQNALNELLSEKRFEDITVGEIAARAMINRATFYRYYEDKYQLALSIFEEISHQLAANLDTPISDYSSIDPDNPPEAWVQFFEHFKTYSGLYQAILVTNRSWFAAKVENALVTIAHQRLEAIGQKDQKGTMPEDVALAFASHLFVGTIAWWLETRHPYSAKQMAGWFLAFILYGYFTAFGIEPPKLVSE